MYNNLNNLNYLDNIINLNDIDQSNNNYINIKLPHEQSLNEIFINIYNSFINIYEKIINNKNPIPDILLSADLIFGLILIILIFLIIIFLFKNII